MKTNVGIADKAIRIILSLVVGALYYFEAISGTVALVLLALAGILIVTSFVSFCPLYAIFGLSTKPKKS
jgi:hypothetical protein